MKPEFLGKLGEDSIFWPNGKASPPQPSPQKSSSTAGYFRRAIRSYRTKHVNGKLLDKQAVVMENPPPGIDVRTSDGSTGMPVVDGRTSDGSSGIATPLRDADAYGTDAESQKSVSSLPSDPSYLSSKEHLMEALISNMFNTISSLKAAYMQLQSAHSPYDPVKLRAADEAVIAELKELSELKHAYTDSMAIMASRQAQEDPEGIESKDIILKSYEGIINNFHTEIQKKNTLVESLKDMLAQTTLKKEKLERRVKRLEQRLSKESSVDAGIQLSPSPQLLEFGVLGASEAARSFTKVFISMMKMAQWDLDAAASSIEPDIHYIRSTHKKFAFESYVCSRMLSGFESDDFYSSGNLPSVLDPKQKMQECFSEFQNLSNADPVEVVNAKPESMFSKFCLRKFIDLIHPKMEESFLGNLDHRKKVQDGIHPTSEFYHSFLKLAKAMWLLHRLAFSFEPTACIFQVKRNTQFSPMYMESIVKMQDFGMSSSDDKLQVGFTVVPGFRVEKTIIKCQVYVMPPEHSV